MKKLKKHNQEIAAAKSGMDVKTARKYIKSKDLPSEMSKHQSRKPRSNPFEEDWDELKDMLENAAGLEAKTLLNYLINKKPKMYNPGQLRSLQRRVKAWRAEYGKSKLPIYRQNIQPGKQSQSDFTVMNSLNITIREEHLKHLLFHFMLPYSRWESVRICYSETFDNLVVGFEKAVWELGYTAPEHRTDNLSAATKAMGDKREFTERWQQAMAHYQINPTTNNPGVSHENGSVEKSHDLLKKAIDQALLLRGYRDFDDMKSYENFIEGVVKTRNDYCLERLAEETELLQELPDEKWHAPTVMQVRVSPASIVQLMNKPYSVPSRLIHYTLKAYIYPDEIILFYGNKRLQNMPRNHDDSLSGINYRHLIDGLVRKPEAFESYRYQEAFFPRLCFRQAYDQLRQKRVGNADKLYLNILQLAKIQSEQLVSDALILLLEDGQAPTPLAVKGLIDVYQQERRHVEVREPCLADYDQLLSNVTRPEVH